MAFLIVRNRADAEEIVMDTPRWRHLFAAGLAALAFVALVTVAVVPQIRLGDQR